MAEAVFMHMVRSHGLDAEIVADSAGTGSWHLGEPPHPGTRGILGTKGITFDHRARLLTVEDLDRFDYIVTMDEQNFEDVKKLGPSRARVSRFLDFSPTVNRRDVPDPYYSGGYGEVYQLIEPAAEGLFAEICREHGLDNRT